MRRLTRILLNAMTVLSLVLFLATVALWVRSYWRADRVDALILGSGNRQVSSWSICLISGSGGFGISVARGMQYYADGAGVQKGLANWTPRRFRHNSDQARIYPRWGGGQTDLRRFGFQWLRNAMTNQNSWTIQRSIVAPYWVAALATVALPALRLHRRLLLRRAARLARAGRCLTCCYDLRATPERCPECGTIPTR